MNIVEGHTPGPWEVGGGKNGGEPGYVYCHNCIGSPVAIVYGKPLGYTVFSRAEEEANARLIASAPAMASRICQLTAELDMMLDQIGIFAEALLVAKSIMKFVPDDASVPEELAIRLETLAAGSNNLFAAFKKQTEEKAA